MKIRQSRMGLPDVVCLMFPQSPGTHSVRLAFGPDRAVARSRSSQRPQMRSLG